MSVQWLASISSTQCSPRGTRFHLDRSGGRVPHRLWSTGGSTSVVVVNQSTDLHQRHWLASIRRLLGIWQTLPPSQRRVCCTWLPCFRPSCTSAAVRPRTQPSWTPPNALTCGVTRGVHFQACVVHVLGQGGAVIRRHVYVVGGGREFFNSSSEQLPPTGNWQTLPAMNVGRRCFSTAVAADKLYESGGLCDCSVERFDPEVGVWELLQPMFQNRYNFAVNVLHGQLCVCGGYNGFQPTSSVERFDPTHNTWERLAPMRCVRGGASAVGFTGGSWSSVKQWVMNVTSFTGKTSALLNGSGHGRGVGSAFSTSHSR